MGAPEMSDKYFHHSFQQLAHYNYQIMYYLKSIIFSCQEKSVQIAPRHIPMDLHSEIENRLASAFMLILNFTSLDIQIS